MLFKLNYKRLLSVLKSCGTWSLRSFSFALNGIKILHKNINHSRILWIPLLILGIITFCVVSDYSVDGMERENADNIIKRNENIRTQLVFHRHQVLNSEQLNHMIETINRLDPIKDARIIQEIQEYLNATGVNLNDFLEPHVQHGQMHVGGNSGNPGPTWTWQSAITSIGVGLGVFVVGYLIFRNWETIHETLFDIIRPTWSTISMESFVRIIPNLAQRHPAVVHGIYVILQSQHEE